MKKMMLLTGKHTRNASDGLEVIRASQPAQQLVIK